MCASLCPASARRPTAASASPAAAAAVGVGAAGGVGRAEIIGNSGGAEPGGDGAVPGGQEDDEQQQGQAEGERFVQPRRQAGEGAGCQQRFQMGSVKRHFFLLFSDYQISRSS